MHAVLLFYIMTVSLHQALYSTSGTVQHSTTTLLKSEPLQWLQLVTTEQPIYRVADLMNVG